MTKRASREIEVGGAKSGSLMEKRRPSRDDWKQGREWLEQLSCHN
jgi:hypothetical protein